MHDLKAVVMVESRTRRAFLAAAASRLAKDEMIVRAVDTYRASGAVTLQVPLDPTAEVVGREAPRLRPGGITELVTYLRVRDPTVRLVTVRGRLVDPGTEIALRALVVPGRVLETPASAARI